MKRNSFFTFFGILVLLIMAGCSSKERLYIFNWAYYTPEEIIGKFEKEYNVKVVLDEFASNEDMFAKLRSGSSGYDIVFPSEDYVSIMIHQNMLEEIDKSKLVNLRNIDPVVLRKAVYDPNMYYSVPYYFGAAGVVVNTAKVPDFEESWSIFGRDDLQGRMIMLDDLREVIGAALVHLGYSANTSDAGEVEAAKNLVNSSWKPNLVKFDSESFGKGYANGDFWVVHAFPETVFEEILDDEEFMRDTYFFIPREGGTAYIDSMCILKGAKNIDLAHKFIDFIHRPEIYAEFCDEFGFPATVNVPARQYKEGPSWYDMNDILDFELKTDLGQSLELYHDAWFNSIRVER